MGLPAEPQGAGRAHAGAGTTEDIAAGNRRDVGARVYPGGFAGITARLKDLLGWWQHTRAARANARFGAAGGGVLTGGIAYAAIFSVFAGLAIGYTIFMAVLGGNDALRQTVLDTIDVNLPGLVKTDSEDNGVIEPADLVLSTGVGITGVIAVVVLLVSAISAMAALRTAVRAMFDADSTGVNIVSSKLRELGGFAGIGFAILLSAVLSIATTTAADWALGLLGLEGSTVAGLVLRGAGILVAFVVDAATFCLIVIVLGAQRPAWRDLRQGALVAAVGLGVVRLLGTSVVAGSANNNAILASFAVIVTLLIWINFIARIVLLAAAWTADPPAPSDVEAGEASTPEPAGA